MWWAPAGDEELAKWLVGANQKGQNILYELTM